MTPKKATVEVTVKAEDINRAIESLIVQPIERVDGSIYLCDNHYHGAIVEFTAHPLASVCDVCGEDAVHWVLVKDVMRTLLRLLGKVG